MFMFLCSDEHEGRASLCIELKWAWGGVRWGTVIVLSPPQTPCKPQLTFECKLHVLRCHVASERGGCRDATRVLRGMRETIQRWRGAADATPRTHDLSMKLLLLTSTFTGFCFGLNPHPTTTTSLSSISESPCSYVKAIFIASC